MTLRYSSLVALLALVPFATHAQLDLTVTDVWGTQQNGQTITYYGEASDLEHEVDLHTTLNGPNALTINVRRYELNTVPGSQNYFCWGVCYLPQNSGLLPTWVSQDEVDLTPGTTFEGFHAFYKPLGTADVAGFRYVWYNVDATNDSTWVDIYFDSAVGIGENAAATTFDVHPNPAVGENVVLEHALANPGSLGSVVLRDVLGNTVLTRSLSSAQGRTVIAAGQLRPGVYFATLEQGGKALMTRRITVAAR